MRPADRRIRALFPLWGSGSIRELPPHRNTGLEIVYVSRGHLRWRIENRTYELGPGTIFYTFPWELHGSVDEFEPGHRWDFVVLTLLGRQSSRQRTLPPGFGMGRAEGRRLLDRLMRSHHRSLPGGERMKWLLPALQKELAAPQGAELAMATTLGKAVLLELEGIVVRASSGGSPSFGRRADPCERLLRRLRSDYAEKWNLTSMSQVMNLGRTRLGQLIKEKTGDSPIVHLNRLRIGKAQELLRRPDQSITEIAFSCGFQSSQYFARTFKQLTGRTPGEYRDTYR